VVKKLVQCLDCGAPINYGYRWCRQCSPSHRKEDPKPPLPRTTCDLCGKYTKGNTLCRSCSAIIRNSSPIYREAISKAVKAAHARGDYDDVDWNTEAKSAAVKRAWLSGVYGEDWRIKQSKAHKGKSINLTEEVRRSKSDKMKVVWASGLYEGIFDGEEYRQLASERTKLAWKEGRLDHNGLQSGPHTIPGTPEFIEKYRKISIGVKKAWEDGRLQCNPSNLEKIIAQALDDFGVEYLTQYNLTGRRYDLYLPELNLLIEVDGEYWHYSETAYSRGQPVKDAEKNNIAISLGYDMVRLHERDIHKYGAQYIVKEILNDRGRVVNV